MICYRLAHEVATIAADHAELLLRDGLNLEVEAYLGASGAATAFVWKRGPNEYCVSKDEPGFADEVETFRYAEMALYAACKIAMDAALARFEDFKQRPPVELTGTFHVDTDL